MKKHLLLFILLISAGPGFSQTPTTFNYTGGVQTYTVPPCVTQIEVIAAGAKGGGATGANGATVTATLNVVPGQILQVNVGGMGNCPGAGYNGGGIGGPAGGANAGCGGGGASDIRIAPFGIANRILVAGGGGGMGGGNMDAVGGAGGCASGVTGNSPFGVGGEGGSQVEGGEGGPFWQFGFGGNNGFPGNIGNGGNGASDPCYNLAPGGGGGGGYYGGGGGGSDCYNLGSIGGGSGGGGSSLTPAGGNCTQGNNPGNGYVTITPNNTGIVLEVTPSSAEICVGGSVEITASGAVNYVWSPDIGLNTTSGATVIASPTSTQTYLITADDGVDCSDTISVTVTVLPDPVVEITPSAPEICPGESVNLTASGASTYAWSPAAGLNNTIGATVTASPASTQTYTVTGTSGDCSADTTVTVTVLDPPEITFSPADPELCQNGTVEITADGAVSYSWSPSTSLDIATGAVVNASPATTTTYTITGTDANGCTNTTEVTATVLPPPDVDAGDDVEICPGSSTTLNGSSNDAVSYSWFPALSMDDSMIANPVAFPDVTTTYTLTVTDINGCTNTDDVMVSVIDASFETTTEADICEGESYTLPDGEVVDQSGTYQNLFTSVSGCDSLVITELSVHPVYDLNESAELCDGETYMLPDGTSANSSGTYVVNLQTVAGCDSVITYELTFHPIYEETIEASICDSQVYTMPDGSEENTGGFYTFNFNTAEGCDSIIHVDLTVQETVIIPVQDSFCENQNYTLPDGSVVNTAGTFDVVISSTGGCDTLFQVELEVHPTFNTTVEAAICSGENYLLPDGSSVGNAGIYPVTFSSVDGCDSIVNIDLEVFPVFDITYTENICSGESFMLPNGTTVNQTGLYPQPYTSVNGCDSIININLIVRPEYNLELVWHVCDNDNALDPYGNPVSEDVAFDLEYSTVYGCDSLVHLQIYYHEAYTDTTEVSFCDGDQFVTSGGQIITSGGIFSDHFLNAGGCDSILIYDVTIMPSPDSKYKVSQPFASIYDGPVQFFNESTNTDSLEWDFGIYGVSQQENPVIEFGDVSGFYPICLSTWNDYGCSDKYCFEYEVREDFAVYIPNAFSPNGDGINDLFYVAGKDIDPDHFRLQIFNRSGELVFETDDPLEKWDGGSQGGEHYSQDNVYVYRVEVRAASVIDSREFVGKVTVLR